jgi:hypothetical protein
LHRNCLQQFHVTGNIERKIEVMERRRTCKELLDGLKETREYWKLKEEAIDVLCGTRCGRDYGIVMVT